MKAIGKFIIYVGISIIINVHLWMWVPELCLQKGFEMFKLIYINKHVQQKYYSVCLKLSKTMRGITVNRCLANAQKSGLTQDMREYMAIENKKKVRRLYRKAMKLQKQLVGLYFKQKCGENSEELEKQMKIVVLEIKVVYQILQKKKKK